MWAGGQTGESTSTLERYNEKGYRNKYDSLRSPSVPGDQVRYKQVSNNVKRKGGAFQGTKFSSVTNLKRTFGSSQEKLDGATTVTQAAAFGKMASLQQDVSVDRGFANTSMQVYRPDGGSTDIVQEARAARHPHVNSSFDWNTLNRGGPLEKRHMKNLLTHY